MFLLTSFCAVMCKANACLLFFFMGVRGWVGVGVDCGDSGISKYLWNTHLKADINLGVWPFENDKLLCTVMKEFSILFVD